VFIIQVMMNELRQFGERFLNDEIVITLWEFLAQSHAGLKGGRF